MKYLVTSVLIAFALVPTSEINAQTAIVSTGNTLQSGNSEVGFTVGEIARANYSSQAGNVSEGIHQPEILINGVSETVKLGKLTVFPNPARNQVTIRQASGESHAFVVFDMAGNLVIPEQRAGTGEDAIIDISRLNSGSYLIRSVSNNSTLSTFNLQIIK